MLLLCLSLVHKQSTNINFSYSYYVKLNPENKYPLIPRILVENALP